MEEWKKVTQHEKDMVRELLPQKVEYHTATVTYAPHSTSPIHLSVYYGESTKESVTPAFPEREVN